MFRWRKVVKKDRKVLHRQAMFTIQTVEKTMRPSLDWDGSEETREACLEEVYIVSVGYGLKGQEPYLQELLVGDSILMDLKASIELSTLEDE